MTKTCFNENLYSDELGLTNYNIFRCVRLLNTMNYLTITTINSDHLTCIRFI